MGRAIHAVPAALILIGCAALVGAWPQGPDLQVDFGRELYLPWRVAQGERLYLDLAHWSGALSVSWHALLFRTFGASLVVVKLSNLVVCGAIAVTVYATAKRLAGLAAAFATTGFFLGAVAFAQLLPLANYDYLTPYTHELTHGLALSLAGLFAMTRFEGDARAGWLCGLILAAVAATKIEVMAAYGAAIAVGFGWPCVRGEAAERAEAFRNLRSLLAGFAIGVLAISFFVSLQSGFEAALRGWVEPWRVLAGSSVSTLSFYRHVMGTLDPLASLLTIFWGALAVTALLFVIASLAVAWQRFGLERGTPLVIVAAVVATWLWPLPVPWTQSLLAPVALMVLVLLVRSIRETVSGRENGAQTAILVFALALTAKMAFNARLAHYGFALYLPAVLVCIAWLATSFPAIVERRGGSARLARVLGFAVVLSLGWSLHGQTDRLRDVRSASVGQGGDLMRADHRATAFNEALAHLESLPTDTTVAVLPEGVMLNYLARRKTSTPYINYMPPELEMYGEQAIVAAFRESPPDVIVLMHKRAGLYGTPFFGRDYGRALYGFATANYRTVETWGGVPFDPSTRFGVRIMVRKEGS